jgi:non-ribosomal peptide synthetase component F
MNKKTNIKDISFAASEYNKERTYWLDKLSGDLIKSYFPYDYDQLNEGNKKYEVFSFSLNDNLYDRLMKITNNSDQRLFVVLFAATTILLDKYTGNKDIVIGIPIDKQEKEGNYLNTILSIRHIIEDDASFKDLLINLKKTITDARLNLNFPIELLQNELNIEFEEGEIPLFDMVVLLENIHAKSYVSHLGLNLFFNFKRTENSIDCKIEYNTALYKESTIERISAHLMNVFNNCLTDVDILHRDIKILSEDEISQTLFESNETQVENTSDKTIIDLFEEQVSFTPEKIALEFEGEKMSYRELNKKADGVAHYLSKLGVKQDTVVALMGKRKIL